MKSFFLVAVNLVCGTMLAACASGNAADNTAANQKLASANCEVEQPRVGSNMSHRVCTPAPVAGAQAGTPATAQ